MDYICHPVFCITAEIDKRKIGTGYEKQQQRDECFVGRGFSVGFKVGG